MKWNIKRLFFWVAFLIIPILLFYLMEFYEHNPFSEVRQMAQFYNIVLFELLALILFFLCGSAKIALRIETVLAMVFGLVNHYVLAFRSTPFVPWDILSVRTAASVATQYDFTPSFRVVLVTTLFVVCFILLGWEKLIWKKRLLRVFPLLLCMGILFAFAGRLQDRKFQLDNYLYPHLFTPLYMMQVNGMAVTFVMDLAYMKVERPEGYDALQCEETLREYETDLAGQDYPNMIVIMDEAFSDLSLLGDVDASEDYMPYVHSLQQGAENTVSGNLYVSVCGGNTANTEFEFLTGNTMAFLPAGSVPYQQYIQGEIPSLASHLESLGYATYAMHPYYASGWNRDVTYPRMGFSNMIFKEDMAFMEYVRKYVSDRSDFQEILHLLEEKQEGQPLFIFNVTMQNHGGYSDQYANFTPDVTTGADNLELNQYLSLIKLTDAGLEELLTHLGNMDEKTVVVFFGDHQPGDAVTKCINDSLTDSDYYYASEEDVIANDTENPRYIVPYIIWANYDIEESVGYDMSVNYLAANTLKIAGVPTDAYQNYLLQLQEEYPVITSVYTGKSADAREESLEEYRRLQYYQLFEKKAGEP
ncbi:MAG: LTA synthase family protein [Lachnospiraceae bacterium]|nr:LTA synthase family protein [Lachnospiraceae bacterium]MDD6504415.1 LTA synthase family protein [Lachnospiraceae bacterium]